jgi:hypothetical protein
MGDGAMRPGGVVSPELPLAQLAIVLRVPPNACSASLRRAHSATDVGHTPGFREDLLLETQSEIVTRELGI